ncbi:O-acetyltransferase OatA [Saezia sanguinis]|uniref:O-acetyltransferase OatA n=1 Tax=Saezia sanguinis TaxID=1965230 RepID=A0A433SA76_9BURK|nr:acyltransferase family protein [Saezia sanguinis]RUS65635.1 O-acetyltransferase OatA [Saezia sanguinis]
MTYKPEIDGLRAIAVLLVLLCHMRLGMAGGFVGVDVFFVISGFLITSIVYNGLDQNKFSFWNFYGRRFVRLYPALLTVVLLTFIAGFLLMDAETFKHLNRAGRYAIVSASNIFFNNNLNYFDQAAQQQIFLHTWSLGVEWQFYLIWPLLMWGVFKLSAKSVRPALVCLIALITIASVAASQWMIGHDAKAAYYLMPYRAFELGLGGLLVFGYERAVKPATGILLVIAGMLAIIASALIYTPKTPFPGVAALLPCLGAVACMYGGKAFTAGNVLKWSPVVFIGKASYSIYLVHWPLLVLYQYYVYRHINTTEKVTLLLASVALGSVVYLLVEKRINWKRLSNKLAGCLSMIGLSVVMLALFYYAGKPGDGLPWRMADNNTLQNPDYYEWGIARFPAVAVLGQPDGQRVAIIGGDSFAANMSTGFDEYLKPLGQNVNRFYEPGCLITAATELEIINIPPACQHLSALTLQDVAQNPGLPLILIQSWGGPLVQADAEGTPPDMALQERYNTVITHNLDDLRTRIGERPLFLVGSPPYRRWGTGEKTCLTRPAYLPQICEQQIPAYPVQASPVSNINTALQAYAQQHDGVYYIDTASVACPGGTCTSERNSMLYFDGFHTSQYGARLVVQDIMRQVNAALAQEHGAQP